MGCMGQSGLLEYGIYILSLVSNPNAVLMTSFPDRVVLNAGAVASIAFGEREPLVDGNVIRVLSRLRAIASDPKNTALNKLCWWGR